MSVKFTLLRNVVQNIGNLLFLRNEDINYVKFFMYFTVFMAKWMMGADFITWRKSRCYSNFYRNSIKSCCGRIFQFDYFNRGIHKKINDQCFLKKEPLESWPFLDKDLLTLSLTVRQKKQHQELIKFRNWFFLPKKYKRRRGYGCS